MYYPHHVHLANGSVGDSILRVKDYVQRGKEYSLKSLTITDHGSLSAIYDFVNECINNNIKPIIGMEAYETENITLKDKEHNSKYHLILLAKTTEGLSNLFKIHNIAATEGFYYKPRVDLNVLKQYGKGIIATSACLAGRIPQAILSNDTQKAINLIQEYKNCFDDFYLEIQPGNFKEQIYLNDKLVELAIKTNTKLIATNDIHYLNKEDAIAHNAHVLLGRKQESLFLEGKMIYPDSCYWFMDSKNLFNSFKKTALLTDTIIMQAINNTVIVANECDVEFLNKVYMPKIQEDIDANVENMMLSDLCYSKLNSIIQNKKNPFQYVQKLENELNTIKQLGFSGYFLIVKDYIDWARNNDIAVGPGRGSAAGSLVSYLLGISKPDPIKYKLMFERFLDIQRAAIPDIDVDFEPTKRDLLFKYIVDKYGYDHCALVGTFQIRKARKSIKDAGRLLGLSPRLCNEISQKIPTVYYGDDDEKITDLNIKTSLKVNSDFAKYEQQYPELFNLAIKLEDLPSSVGVHAAGALISPIPLIDKIPLIKPNKEGILATSLNLDGAEKNFVKFDFLGLAYMEIIHNTEKEIGKIFDFENDTLLNDQNVWNMIGSKHTTGIFQISSKTYKDRMHRLKPKTIEELAACLALIRGPCISTKLDEKYMRILEGKDKITYLCKEYNEPTKDTLGIPIFQEQIMKIFVNFGFDLSTGYKFIKAAAKKKIDKLKSYKNEFLIKAKERHISKTLAEKIFHVLETSGQYSFNKAHAVSYAFITYCSAYLKYHYPLQYMKNLLTNVFVKVKNEKNQLLYKEIIQECRYLGIKFLPPDINKSNWEFSVENDKIRIGVCAIKGIGEKAFKHILSLRPFVSLDDMLERIEQRSFNKNVFNTSVFSGMLDTLIDNCIYKNRLDLYKKRNSNLDCIKIAGKEISIDFLIDADNYPKIEELLLGCNFIYCIENTLNSIDLLSIKNKDMFKLSNILIKKVNRPKLDLEGNLFLVTGNGDITCKVLPNIYKRTSKIINGIRKTNKYDVIAVKKDNNCYLQEIAKCV